jgi:hypothetical protein
MIRLTITPVGGGTVPVGSRVPIVSEGPGPSTVLGALAEFSDASARYVEASWASSDDRIIAIDDGTIAARGRGHATLTVSYQGFTDTETFIAEGGVVGSWSGRFLIEQCVATSQVMLETVCGTERRPNGMSPTGSELPFRMVIGENGTDLTAAAQIGSFHGTLTGLNRGAGYFFLQGDIRQGDLLLRIFHWDAVVVRDAVEGYVGYEIQMRGESGVARVAGKLVDMTRQ